MGRSNVIQGSFPGGRFPVLQAVLPTAQASKPAAKAIAPPPVRFPGQKPASAQAKPAVATPGKVPPPKPAAEPKPIPLSGGQAFQVPPTLNLSKPGGGQRLPEAVQKKMEAFFGASFDDVRVHVGPQASSIGALAFTLGSDLYFAPGQYSPDTVHGQQLLGHELTHVVQQRAGRVRNPFGSGVAVVQDHHLEAEADRMGQRAAAHAVTVQAKRVLPALVAIPRTVRLPFPSGVARGAVQRSALVSVSGMIPAGNGSYRIVVGAGGQQAGSVMVHSRGESAIEVTDLVVDPSHRKQGLGGVLMASAVRAGLQLGKSKVTLASQDRGTGRLTAWYKNMGFAQVGSNSLGYPVLEAPIGRALSGVAQGRMLVSRAAPPREEPSKRVASLSPALTAPRARTAIGAIQRAQKPSNIEFTFTTQHGSTYSVDEGTGLTRQRYYGGTSQSDEKTVLYGDEKTTEACLAARSKCELYKVYASGFGTWSIEFLRSGSVIYKGTLKQWPETGLYPVDMILSDTGKGTKDDRFHVGDRIT